MYNFYSKTINFEIEIEFFLTAFSWLSQLPAWGKCVIIVHDYANSWRASQNSSFENFICPKLPPFNFYLPRLINDSFIIHERIMT